MEDEECCAICMGCDDDIRETVCGHRFCQSCLERWAMRKHTCPACRAPLLLRMTSAPSVAASKNSEVVKTVRFSDRHQHAGVQLTWSWDSTMRVSKLERNDAMYAAGLRVGDVIERINDLTCKSADDACKVLTFAATKRATVHCVVVERATRRRRAFLGRLVRALRPTMS